jgi:hypothetical protein
MPSKSTGAHSSESQRMSKRKTSKTYSLANPQIKGSLPTKIEAEDAIHAARALYAIMAKNFTKPMDSFNIVIQDEDTGEFYHFSISEKEIGKNPNGDVKVDYVVTELEGKFPKEFNDELVDLIEEHMAGGTYGMNGDHLYDSDDEDSNEGPYYNLPIKEFAYFYLPYSRYYQFQAPQIRPHHIAIPTFRYQPTLTIRLDLVNF